MSAISKRSKLLFVLIAFSAATQTAAGILATTTEDIGRPYKVIEGTCIYSQARGMSFSSDPIEGAINKAFEKMEIKARNVGADALVEFDIDFANRTQKDEGRVVLCGTLVKFK